MKILQRKPSLWTLFTLALLAFFVLFVVYPLFLILYQSVIDPVHHQVTLDYFTNSLAASSTGLPWSTASP